MRQLALAVRRSHFERASEETFDVELGRTLDRLLPPELLALRHPTLRRDLLRRHAEGQLLCYRLRGADERGRGPMIVCLDGSSSMAGEKQIADLSDRVTSVSQLTDAAARDLFVSL
jgi:uncharacterized protein with von Willebrand factor type A (vWA) domain